MNVMSSLKPAWHLEKIAKLRRKQDIVPTHLQLIISDLCNQDCHFCAYRMEGGFSTELFPEGGKKNPARFIPIDKAIGILDDAAALGVKAIEFTGGGEPTVHPQWAAIISHAQGLGLKTGLVTNGTRIGGQAELLSKLTWLRISLDAGNELTYAAIRQSKLWDKVLENIRYAASISGPLLGLGFVITLENFHEVVDACILARELKVPYVRLSAMFSHKGAAYYEGVEEGIRSYIREAKNLETAEFKIVDFFGARVEDLRLEAPDYDFCGYQQFVLYIGGDLKVYTCCTNAYTRKGEIGDLKKMGLYEWVRDTRRYDFNARSCHHCQFNDKNRLINYLIDPNPPHVEFV